MIDFKLKEKFKEIIISGGKIPADYFDLGIAFWLLNPDEDFYTAEYLCQKYLHKDPLSLAEEKLKKQLHSFAVKQLKKSKLEKLFYEVEMPLLAILADMEVSGIKVDIKELKKLDKDLDGKLVVLVKNIYKEAGLTGQGETFNINSPKQVGQILFQKLKISEEGVKKTKGGAISTNIDTLMTIRDRHPIVKHLLEYRELFKLQSTYVRPLQELADKKQRIHTTYIQTGTSTGRLSSQNPNLQNIPAEGEWAKKVRGVFIPEKGYELAAFDYSQIELRVLASLSGDPKMMEAFNNDMDIHKITAANVFNVTLDRVTPEMRRLAKTLNFGVVYGMGANAFAKTSGLSFAEAKKFIEEYFKDFTRIKEWQEEAKTQARTFGYVTNLNGRRRWLLEASSMFRGEAAEAERSAINMPVQGLAADIIKIAMIRVAEDIKNKKWQDDVRMLLTIHDELLFEIRHDIIKEASRLIVSGMEKAYELEVPIRVTTKIGSTWGELEAK